jgi:primary-amine oxidase
VTAYDPSELYAAGRFPNANASRDGLPAYVARQRSIVNADIVVWYTMGFHHVPRPEDWPVMPTQWHSVSLIPDGFFDRNPAFNPPAGSVHRLELIAVQRLTARHLPPVHSRGCG